MAEAEAPTPNAENAPAAGAARSKDEVALELMKFIAVSTGYIKSSQSAAGFSGKTAAHSAEEHAEALLDLYERCRRVVKKES
jgi:hypothetical protein